MVKNKQKFFTLIQPKRRDLWEKEKLALNQLCSFLFRTIALAVDKNAIKPIGVLLSTFWIGITIIVV